LNTKQHDFNLLRLKDALLKENCSSGMWTQNIVNKLFSNDLKFLSSSIFAIYIEEPSKLLKVINCLGNMNFYFIYNNRFSNLMNKNIFLNLYNQNNKLCFLHFSIFKLLFNIIIILIYFITSILKYINIK
jgi:hypothetical protein